VRWTSSILNVCISTYTRFYCKGSDYRRWNIRLGYRRWTGELVVGFIPRLKARVFSSLFIIVWGALTDKDDFHPDTRLEAEQNGLVHFWIELEDDEPEPIVAEIATETTTVTGTLPGDPLVMRGRPNDYTVPDNCRFQYDPAIHSKDLCNEEGYRKLVGNGHRLS